MIWFLGSSYFFGRGDSGSHCSQAVCRSTAGLTPQNISHIEPSENIRRGRSRDKGTFVRMGNFGAHSADVVGRRRRQRKGHRNLVRHRVQNWVQPTERSPNISWNCQWPALFTANDGSRLLHDEQCFVMIAGQDATVTRRSTEHLHEHSAVCT